MEEQSEAKGISPTFSKSKEKRIGVVPKIWENKAELGELFKETAETETGMAGKSSWDQANRPQKLGLVWRIRKKISQIIKDYFYLPHCIRPFF